MDLYFVIFEVISIHLLMSITLDVLTIYSYGRRSFLHRLSSLAAPVYRRKYNWFHCPTNNQQACSIHFGNPGNGTLVSTNEHNYDGLILELTRRCYRWNHCVESLLQTDAPPFPLLHVVLATNNRVRIGRTMLRTGRGSDGQGAGELEGTKTYR